MAANLDTIRTKIRRLTRSPDENSLSTNDIDEYINTFILYDFPQEIRLFDFRRVLTFYTKPYQGDYSTNTNDANDPLFNFKNAYISTHDPIYIAGYEASFSQNRNEFYRWFPFINSVRDEATGNGVTDEFEGTLTDTPIVPGHVLFTSIDTNGDGLVVKDDPTSVPFPPGDAQVKNLVSVDDGSTVGTINYRTGAYDFEFTTSPANGEPIQSQTVPYSPARPHSVLYFNNTFTLRPIPDQPYEVRVEVYVRPTELENAADEPFLEQYWQYIAYGAAKKIFEDRSSMDDVQQIMSEFKRQEKLCLRKTLSQLSNNRTETIYTSQLERGYNNWGNNNF